MEKDKNKEILHIISVSYFLLALIMLAIKFGIIIEDKFLAYKIFEIYYYALIPIMAISFILIIIFVIKSKKMRSLEDGNKLCKSILDLINIFVISFQVFTALIRTFTVELIANNWFLVTIYISIIFIIIDFLVYLFFRHNIVNEYNLYNQSLILDRYIIYAVIVSFLFAITIPNFTIHFGIMNAIKNY